MNADALLELPPWSVAPAALLRLDGHCGALAAWVVLRHCHIRTSSASLVQALRHSRKWGVFTIGIAVALAEHGLEVVFHSDPDPDMAPPERALYARARRLRIPIEPAIDISRLRHAMTQARVPVVFYRTATGEGHFSPVAGIDSGRIVLPNDVEGRLSIPRFRRAWRQPGFPRQVVIARRPAALPPVESRTR